LREKFEEDLQKRLAIHHVAPSSAVNFRRVIRDFDLFLSTREEPISMLRDIDPSMVREFRYWRVENIQKKKGPDGGGGVYTELGHLHRVFAFAMEEQMIAKNPVEYESDQHAADRGAQPYEPKELILLRENLADEEDILTFLVFRWTGLRASDAASLVWSEVNLENREIRKPTKKSHYKKVAIIPIQEELASALETERALRKPKPSNPILRIAKCKRREQRPFYVIQQLGERAGVPYARPHRFRDTFAVDALLKDISVTSVASMLADTVKYAGGYS
jgi:integrase